MSFIKYTKGSLAVLGLSAVAASGMANDLAGQELQTIKDCNNALDAALQQMFDTRNKHSVGPDAFSIIRGSCKISVGDYVSDGNKQPVTISFEDGQRLEGGTISGTLFYANAEENLDCLSHVDPTSGNYNLKEMVLMEVQQADGTTTAQTANYIDRICGVGVL